MNNKEKTEWKDLCEYIKTEILKYNNDKIFPKMLALRLKGIACGKEYPQGEITPIYTFGEIKMLFVYAKSDILKALDSVQIKNEKHLCNLIMRIAQDNLNDFSEKLKNKKNNDVFLDKVEDFGLNNHIIYKKKDRVVKKIW